MAAWSSDAGTAPLPAASSLLVGSPEPRRPAVFDATSYRWWSYGELLNAVDAARGALALDGRKHLAFCYCRNDVRTLVLYLAALEAGHAVVLVDESMDDAFQDRMLAAYRPALVVGSAPEVGRRAAGAGYDRTAAGMADAAVYRSPSVPEYEVHSDLAVLLSTSGSTGSPKLVRLSYRNVQSNAASIAEALGIGPDERAISSLPMHYSYGLSVVNSHLLAGASLVLTPHAITEAPFWSALRETRCTSMAGVPYSYQLLRRLDIESLDVPSLMTLTQAGGRLETAFVRHFHEVVHRRGGRLFVMYGQTEATARIAILPADRLPEKLGSVGRAIPGGRLSVDRAPGVPRGPHAAGEVIYGGPNVMMGYAESAADLARGDELHGELRTGDIGYLDDEEFLYITGRLKRIAKVFGHRVSLDDVEALLRQQQLVAAAVATDDRIVVFCEGEVDTSSYKRLLANATHIHQSAFECRSLDALPHMPSGKIDYVQLRSLVG